MQQEIKGKYYLPIDNSYSINITKPIEYKWHNYQLNYGYLAGTSSSTPILCETISEPFDCKLLINDSLQRYIIKQMIMVKSIKDDSCHCVLYFEHGLAVDERIKELNAHQRLNNLSEYSPFDLVERDESKVYTFEEDLHN